MRTLSIDIETYSDVDIKLGVYRYTDTPNFEILLFAYAFDEEPVRVIDLACGEDLDESLIKALSDAKVLKKAYNAQFERVCLGKHLGVMLEPGQWKCTMAHAAYLGLPGKLGEVAKVLNLDEQKDKAGKMLINYFSKPCKPTRSNQERTRNYPYHDMEKWELFKKYNAQDVETERAISHFLENYEIPVVERWLYTLDQRMADYGVGIDLELVKSIVGFYDSHADAFIDQSRKLTGLQNPNSQAQLLDWLNNNGLEITDIRKATLEAALENESLKPAVRTVIENRLETGKASVKKYQMMLDATCSDERMHGVMFYYGARTGRWAGRLVQVQNLTKNYMEELDSTRTLVKKGEFETLEYIYDSMSDVLKQLVRTAFVPPKGYKYAIADYSAIEARVIAWLADEKWAMDVFAKDSDIYKQTASQMFHIPYEQIDKSLRQKGKVSVLALGYEGGAGALKAMGALKMGIPEEELPVLVKKWRKANPHIVKLWKDVEDAARLAIKTKKHIELHHGVSFDCDGMFLRINLPIGRSMSYFRPRINDDGKIEFSGKETNKNVFGTNTTFGGKLVENIVQALARDCLAEALTKIDGFYKIVFHVHDEVIVEVEKDRAKEHLKTVQEIMGEELSWAPGLYLSSAGYTADYYLKD